MKTRMLVLGLAVGGLLVACEKEEPLPSSGVDNAERTDEAPDTGTPTVGETIDESAEDLRETGEGALDEAREAAGGQTDELKAQAVAAAEDRLTQVETKLEDVETRLASAAEPIKSAVTPLVQQARTQFTAIEGRVTELRNAGPDQWQAIGNEITTALGELEQTIAEAASKLGG